MKIVSKRVMVKRERVTICTYKDLMKKFQEQSIRMNESMSRRIENFVISELKKEEQKDDNK